MNSYRASASTPTTCSSSCTRTCRAASPNLSPQERLVMLEEAVGFNTFRRDVVDAKQRLGGILSEEQSLNQLLDRARETLAYWREQNERLQEKKQLQTRMNFLQREMAWSRVLQLEGNVKELEQELDQADADLYSAEEEMNRFSKAVVDSDEALKQLRGQWMEFIERRVEAEKALGISEFSINSSKDRIQSINKMLGSSGEQRKKLELTAQTLRERLKKGPTKLDDYFNIIDELEKTQTETFEGWSGELITQRSEAESRIKQLSRQLSDAEAAVSRVTEDMEVLRVRDRRRHRPARRGQDTARPPQGQAGPPQAPHRRAKGRDRPRQHGAQGRRGRGTDQGSTRRDGAHRRRRTQRDQEDLWHPHGPRRGPRGR